MRLVFAGTGDFALPILAVLHGQGLTVALVVTQPDRPAGRGLRLRPSPLKEAALARGLEVVQPPRIRDGSAVERIRAGRPDALVVAAYGQILSPELLTLAPLGAINVHASLLPRHRGPAPIQWTILLGDRRAGVTIMQMDTGVDTGPILNQQSIPVASDETARLLQASLAALGAGLLVATLTELSEGRNPSVPQAEAGATYARRPTPEDGDLDRDLTAVEIDRKVRALNPDPGCWLTLAGRRIKVLEGSPADGPHGARGHPVPTRQGAYVVRVVQPPGGRPMPVEDYLRGRR